MTGIEKSSPERESRATERIGKILDKSIETLMSLEGSKGIKFERAVPYIANPMPMTTYVLLKLMLRLKVIRQNVIDISPPRRALEEDYPIL